MSALAQTRISDANNTNVNVNKIRLFDEIERGGIYGMTYAYIDRYIIDNIVPEVDSQRPVNYPSWVIQSLQRGMTDVYENLQEKNGRSLLATQTTTCFALQNKR